MQIKKIGVYAGIDPTASSLHVGHLLPFMVLFWLYHFGHHTISLVGGATARIGDPTGRLSSREEQGVSILGANVRQMSAQLQKLWDNAVLYGEKHGFNKEQAGTTALLNNSAWLENISIVEFLGTLGRNMRIGAMLGRDT